MEEKLTEITRGLGEVTSLEDLLPYVLERATEMFDADRALFAILTPKGRYRRVIRHNMSVADDGSLPVSETVLRAIIDGRRVRVFDDALSSIDFQKRDSVKLHNIRFVMGTPVRGGSKMQGLLYIDSITKTFPEPEERDRKSRALEALAGLVSMAMRNLETVEEINYRTRFVRSVVHNFRNQAQVIRYNADILASNDQLGDDQPLVETIKGETERMSSLSGLVLKLYKLEEAGSSQPVWVDPVVEVHQRARALEVYAKTTNRKGITVADTPAPMIYTDPRRFGMVIDELLVNAIKYSAVGQGVDVSVVLTDDGRRPPERSADTVEMHGIPQLRAKAGSRFVRFSVSNTNRSGPIPADQLPSLFEPYTNDADDFRYASFGLGLSVVREIITSLGGDVWVESNSERTTFFFDLPKEAEAISETPEPA